MWSDWSGLSPGERGRRARALAGELPEGWRFVGIRQHALAGQRGAVAHFERAGVSFVLVPGGEVTLGFDASSWEPLPGESRSYRSSAAEYGLPKRATTYVRKHTRPPRQVTVPPLLVEAQPVEIAWSPLPLDTEEGRQLVSEHLPPGDGPADVTVYRGRRHVRLRRRTGGAIEALSASGATHREITEQLAGQGFRLPTADEWEHLCGGGARTLYRWGDHAPADRYPVDPGFDEHLAPNAFGVVMSGNPYKWELVAEPDQLRGGDGGTNICGGVGFFLGWVTLATAFEDEYFCRRKPDEPVSADFTIGRRVLELS
jgi:hypothetical protein